MCRLRIWVDTLTNPMCQLKSPVDTLNQKLFVLSKFQTEKHLFPAIFQDFTMFCTLMCQLKLWVDMLTNPMCQLKSPVDTLKQKLFVLSKFQTENHLFPAIFQVFTMFRTLTCQLKLWVDTITNPMCQLVRRVSALKPSIIKPSLRVSALRPSIIKLSLWVSTLKQTPQGGNFLLSSEILKHPSLQADDSHDSFDNPSKQ